VRFSRCGCGPCVSGFSGSLASARLRAMLKAGRGAVQGGSNGERVWTMCRRGCVRCSRWGLGFARVEWELRGFRANCRRGCVRCLRCGCELGTALHATHITIIIDSSHIPPLGHPWSRRMPVLQHIPRQTHTHRHTHTHTDAWSHYSPQDLEARHQGRDILLVSHGDTLSIMQVSGSAKPTRL
jgi:hypothetical protein